MCYTYKNTPEQNSEVFVIYFSETSYDVLNCKIIISLRTVVPYELS